LPRERTLDKWKNCLDAGEIDRKRPPKATKNGPFSIKKARFLVKKWAKTAICGY